MKTIKTKCANCDSEIEKSVSEYKRNKQKNRRNFCNRACSISKRNKELTPEYRKIHGYKISKHAGNRQNELSPFKSFLGKGRYSNKKHNMSLSPEFLKELWDKQNGKCPYTGIKMELPINTLANSKLRSLKKASLDRIDSSKKYNKNNVEFVCMGINSAKNSFSKQEMQDFIAEIKNPEALPLG